MSNNETGQVACPADGPAHEVPCAQCGACEADTGAAVPERNRRQVLGAAVKFSAVMASAGLCATSLLMGKDAEAAVPQDPNTVNLKATQDLIDHAINTQNMPQAVQIYGQASNLEPEVIQELLQITSQQLFALHNIRDRFRTALEMSGLSEWQVVEHNTY